MMTGRRPLLSVNAFYGVELEYLLKQRVESLPSRIFAGTPISISISLKNLERRPHFTCRVSRGSVIIFSMVHSIRDYGS